MDIDRLTTEERDKCIKEGRCFTCQERGHLTRECPRRQRNRSQPNRGRGGNRFGNRRNIRATTTNDDTDTMSTNSAEDASTSDTYTDTSMNDILTLIRTMDASAKNSLREQLENEGF